MKKILFLILGCMFACSSVDAMKQKHKAAAAASRRKLNIERPQQSVTEVVQAPVLPVIQQAPAEELVTAVEVTKPAKVIQPQTPSVWDTDWDTVVVQPPMIPTIQQAPAEELVAAVEITKPAEVAQPQTPSVNALINRDRASLKLVFTKHVLRRLQERGISESQVISIIRLMRYRFIVPNDSGTTIYEGEHRYSLPPIRVITKEAVRTNEVIVITALYYNEEFKKRPNAISQTTKEKERTKAKKREAREFRERIKKEEWWD